MTTSAPTLAARLRGDETLVTAWSAIPDPQVADILARCPYDAVTLDMQHGQQRYESIVTGPAAGDSPQAASITSPTLTSDSTSL